MIGSHAMTGRRLRISRRFPNRPMIRRTFDDTLTKAEAWKRIDALKARVSREAGRSVRSLIGQEVRIAWPLA
jgi:hypothetical protein